LYFEEFFNIILTRNEFKNYLISLDIAKKVFQSFQYKDKFITLMIVQFFKLLMKINEHEITMALIKPLKSIVCYFVEKCQFNWNLIKSSILEVFQIIIQEEMIALLTPIIVSFVRFERKSKYSL